MYPILKKHYQWCKKNFQKENGLYFGDALGSGMDNLPRYPRGFNGADDALKLNLDVIPEGIRAWLQEEYMPTLHPQWNKQGSFIDMSSQVAFNAKNLAEISQILGLEDEGFWISEYDFLKQLINEKCW